MSRVLISLLLAAASCLESGCATMAQDAAGQAIWVRTDPPGANIKVRGDMVGQTPLYVIVPRMPNPKLYLSRDGIEKEVAIKTRYRWQASFFSNFIFYVFAPAGWLIDLLTGRAWAPEDPPMISFRKPDDKKIYLLSYPDAVAIAPPLASSLPLSDASLPILQQAIESRRRQLAAYYSVLPYESTLSLFLKHGFDFDGDGNYDDERMVFERLDADAIWRSTLISMDDGLHLDARLEDKRNHQTIDELHILLDTPSWASEAYETGRRLFGLPNAVTVSLSTQNFTVDRSPNNPVTLQPSNEGEWWRKGLSYLSAVSITNIPSYRPGRSGRWQFSLYPVLRVSHRDFIATGAADLDGQTYSRWLVALGYGPELGYQVHRSYFYSNLIFSEAWTQVSWRFNETDSSTTNFAPLVSGEAGYIYSLSEFWNLRLFFNASAENGDTWKDAVSRTSKQGLPASSKTDNIANISTVGISVGYSFEPLLVRGFREKEKAHKFEPPAPLHPLASQRNL